MHTAALRRLSDLLSLKEIQSPDVGAGRAGARSPCCQLRPIEQFADHGFTLSHRRNPRSASRETNKPKHSISGCFDTCGGSHFTKPIFQARPDSG